MKTHSLLSILVGLALLTGCVMSLNPVYTESDLIFEPALLGVWSPEKSPDIWHFTRNGENEYLLLYTDKEGNSGRFAAHLAEVEGAMFLDLYPEKIESGVSGFHAAHYLPIHSIYLVKEIGNDVKLAGADLRWLKEYLNEHPEAVPHATYNGNKLLTATTEEVQAFLVNNQKHFTIDITLNAVTP